MDEVESLSSKNLSPSCLILQQPLSSTASYLDGKTNGVELAVQQGTSNVQAVAATAEDKTEEATDSASNSGHGSTQEEPEVSQQVKSKPPTITVQLSEEELWKAFYEVGNEMIVTKPGRRLFPALAVSLKGLNPTTVYNITLKMASADQYRYKFINMRWTKAGDSEVNQDEDKQIYLHPESPSSGAFWMKKPISFRGIKITHNPNSKSAHILLHTMHKYVIQLILSPADHSGDHVITLPDTTFVAVSAYQNTALTQLKIDNNPFAKGFRERPTSLRQLPAAATFPSYRPVPYYRPANPLQQSFLPVSFHPLQQVQPAQQFQCMQAAQGLPTMPYIGCMQNCSPYSTATMTASSSEAMKVPSPSSNLPSQLAPYYPNQGCPFYTSPKNMGILNMPRIDEYPQSTKQQ